MDLEVATPPVEESTPAAPTAEQPVEQPDDKLSIAEHRDKFSSPQDRLHPAPSRSRDGQTGRFLKGGTEPEKATQEKPATEKPIDAKAADEKKRHRERDVARPEDVPRIRELSAEVQRLRKQLETRTASSPQPRTAPQPQARPAPAQNGNGAMDHWAFPKPEPKQVDFANADDPYAAWLEARQDWKLEKRDWEASLQQQTSTAQETEQQFWGTFDGKLKDFADKTPDYHEIFAGDGPEHMREDMPPAMTAMIFMDDNPGQLMYAFARDPALFDEVASWSSGVRIPPPSASEEERTAALAAVSRLRRMLDRRGLTGSSGSVPAPQAITVAPRPPNPLRTGPMRTGDEPPGDSGSMADHIRHFGRKNR